MRASCIASIAAGALMLPCVAHAQEEEPAQAVDCAAASSVGLETGDLVEDGRISVEVPEPGRTVNGTIVLKSGSEQLELDRPLDGSLSIESCGSERTASARRDDPENPRPGTAACQDDAYDLANYKFRKDFKWEFNSSSTPGELTVGGAEDKIRDATTNITESRNSCEMADEVSATQSYEGRSGREANIVNGDTADPDCTSQDDGKSVVEFGVLPAGSISMTCTWGDHGQTINSAESSDARLNKANASWTTTPADSACSGLYSVEAALTTSRGLSFGLDFISETAHPNLTMSQIPNGTCQNSEATLGKGDVKGLRDHY